MKRIFKFRISYFKKSGKWYADEEFMYAVKDIVKDPIDGESYGARGYKVMPPPCPYMYDVIDYIQGVMDGHYEESLPGLSCREWDGPIVITSDDGFPAMFNHRGIE